MKRSLLAGRVASLWGRPTGPRLIGERTYLRPPLPDDWRAWADLRRASRSFLAPWEPSWPADALTAPAFRRRLRQYAREREAQVGHAFLLFRGEDDRLLGGISLSNLRRGVAQSASLGYWMGRPHARQGYMSEGLSLLLEWSFSTLGLHRLEAACLPENLASRALLEKAGFHQEGIARALLRIDGRWQDHVLYALLESGWQDRRRASSPARDRATPA